MSVLEKIGYFMVGVLLVVIPWLIIDWYINKD